MGKQVSASNTTLFLKCQYPFSDDVEIPPEEDVDEAPRYGSAFHSLMEEAPLEVGSKFPALAAAVDRVGETWNLRPAVREELAGHVKGSLPVLQKWLGGKNKFGRKFNVKRILREKSYAVRVSSQGGAGLRPKIRTRRIANPTAEGHVYEELEKGEIAMTADLEDVDFVMDHKTGSRDDNFARPHKNGQLKTLSLVGNPTREGVVAIFHADRRGLPIIYAEEISPAAKAKHAARLHRAMRRVDRGYLRPGAWCKFCPARGVCPTQTAELLSGAASLIDGGMATLAKVAKRGALTTPEQLGSLHYFFSELDRIKSRAWPLMRVRVKETLAEGKIVTRPQDGKELVIRTRQEERLSKQRIVDALGVKEAERLFAKLRKAGALETTESEGLWAVFPA